MEAGPKRPVDDSPLPFSSAALPSQQFAQLCGGDGSRSLYFREGFTHFTLAEKFGSSHSPLPRRTPR